MSSQPPVTTIPNTFRMWSKTFKPGDGKVKRDVAMSAQVVSKAESQKLLNICRPN